MKKIFKVLSILAATTALTAGIATATACSAGYNGTYEGEYSYQNYGHTYGMKVKVTVENNIITKVENITPEDWVVVSDANDKYGWPQTSVNNWNRNEAWLLQMYNGRAVSEIKDVEVFVKTNGEPYEVKDADGVNRNVEFGNTGLLISGATQGSARLMLAVQNALSK